ncbi:MAG TPA: SDR family oxidoreductase [Dehalococcoidia bacterium]|nr:SDR family oxidoreductase [Dehalococcoidia bacterium]
MRLAGKVALITGAGSGQGRTAVHTFLREGAWVVAVDVNAAGLDETVNAVGGGPDTLVPVVGSVADAADVDRMVRAARDHFGALHVLYNNAGVIDQRDGPVAEITDEIWDRTLNVNLRGIYYCCKAAIPLLIESGGGSIINIASGAALVGAAGAAYTASKGGVVSLTRVIATDYGRFGIRCNAICPGVINTPMARGGEERMARVARFNPVKRIGEPEDIVNCAVYLASDESTFMTGAILPLDGGATAR